MVDVSHVELCSVELYSINYDAVYMFQLNDGVNAFQRRFVGEIQRCEAMERQLSELLTFLLLAMH